MSPWDTTRALVGMCVRIMFKYCRAKKDVTVSVSLLSALRHLQVYHGHRSEGCSLAIRCVDKHHIPARVPLMPPHCLNLKFCPFAAAHIDVACRNPLSCIPLVTRDRTIDGQKYTWRFLVHIQLLYEVAWLSHGPRGVHFDQLSATSLPIASCIGSGRW